MEAKKLTLGIFGFGCVGEGFYHVLQRANDANVTIKKICVRNTDKPYKVAKAYFTTDRGELLNDPEIDVIVELIDDAEAAFEIVSAAMRSGKAVVSANKKMIAERLPQLLELEKQFDTSFLYEASVCASIPIIRNLEEYYNNQLLTSVCGIFNGSTNYILTKMIEEQMPYATALKEAQEKGFAESDPTLDVEGFDSRYKLSIVIFHAFGLIVNPQSIFTVGISRIGTPDLAYAAQHGYTIKLLARCFKNNSSVSAFCVPTFVGKANPLSNVRYEYNGGLLTNAFNEPQLMVGKGAGGEATSSAVYADLVALENGYRYGRKKYDESQNLSLTNSCECKVYVRHDGTFDGYDDFTEVEEKQKYYLVGSIRLDVLARTKWLKNQRISLLFFE